jgi:hypothetical protein
MTWHKSRDLKSNYCNTCKHYIKSLLYLYTMQDQFILKIKSALTENQSVTDEISTV